MPILSRLAEALAAKVDQPLTDAVKDWTAAGTRLGFEGDERRAHDKWARSARLGTKYYGVKASLAWIWPEQSDNPILICDQMWVFERQTRGGEFVTRSGIYSFQAWHDAGYAGLTTSAPRTPDRPREFPLTADDIDGMSAGSGFTYVG